jgi:hypothetical protein
MKIRTGFVANSSSSSFLVRFPEWPKDCEVIKKLLFGDEEEIHDPWYGGGKTKDVANYIYEKFWADNDFTTASLGQILDVMIEKEEDNYDWKEVEDHREEIETEALKKAREWQDKEGYSCVAEIGDHESYGALVEHGEILTKLDHIRLNHH